MPLSGSTHRKVLACMLLFGSVREYRVSLTTMGESKDDLWIWWLDPKIFYPDIPNKHYADAFRKVFRTCTCFHWSKSKTGWAENVQNYKANAASWVTNKGRILRRNPDNSLRVFRLVIHSHNTALPWDFCFFKLTQPLTVSTVTVHFKGETEENLKEKLYYVWFKKSTQKLQVWKLARWCSETSKKIVLYWIRLLLRSISAPCFGILIINNYGHWGRAWQVDRTPIMH